jgi:hypothetical protein
VRRRGEEGHRAGHALCYTSLALRDNCRPAACLLLRGRVVVQAAFDVAMMKVSTHAALVGVLLAMLATPLLGVVQREVTTVLWDADARHRVLRQVVRRDFSFKDTVAIQTPSGPALLAAVSSGDDRMRFLRIERQKGTWEIAFSVQLAADTHNFMRIDGWSLVDADRDGSQDAVFEGCHPAWCGGAFSVALFGAREPGGWIVHVLLGSPVELTLSGKPPAKAYRGFLLERILQNPLAAENRTAIESWFRKLP